MHQCAILAGGLGTRLGILTRDTPKPMLKVAGCPFLLWIMRALLPTGIKEFVLLTGHLGDRIETEIAALAAALPPQVRIKISKEPVPAGTGGALFHARGLLEDRFLLVNGDSLFLTDLNPALEGFASDADNSACRMVLRCVPDAGRYGVVSLERDRVTRFAERPDGSGPGLINTGIYLMNRHLVDRAVSECSLERDLLPQLIAEGAVRGTIASGWFIDIGVPSDLHRARMELRSRFKALSP